MKLRIADNSIRLRLGRSEVARFAALGTVESRVEFGGGGALVFQLVQTIEPADGLQAAFENNVLTVTVPRAMAELWTASEDVSMHSAAPLQVLVEKDFHCLHEDHAAVDAYPNPLASGDGTPLSIRSGITPAHTGSA